MALDKTLRSLNDCGCCEGVIAQTPVHIYNRPGLTALVYRVGDHEKFKQTLIARLSGSGQTALRRLTTRENDDLSIALLDSWAVVADVLAFYQERIITESYLRTSIERISLLELARLIGYELSPGVSANTYLAFTIEDTPGAFGEVLNTGTTVQKKPIQSPPVTIDIGMKVQSIPGPGEKAQTFETVEKIEARAEWNSIMPRIKKQHEIGRGTTKLFLKGTDTQLQPGDAILLVGDTRENDPFSERWDLRILQTVATDSKEDHTLVTWEEDLGHRTPIVDPADNPKLFVFRQRAALFGYNAPDWYAVSDATRKAYLVKANRSISSYTEDDPDTWGTNWPSQIFKIRKVAQNQIYLDNAYPKILKGSWVALVKPNYIELYKANDVEIDSQTDFTLTSKTTRIKLDTNENLDWFGLRNTVVLAQSDQIELAEVPVTTPVFGDKIELSERVKGIENGHTLIVSGKRLRQIKVANRTHKFRIGREITETKDRLYLFSRDGLQEVELESGEVLDVLGPPVWVPGGSIKWHLMNGTGFSGFVTAKPDDFMPKQETEESTVTSQLDTDENNRYGSEVVIVEEVNVDGTLVLATTLKNVYYLDTVTINANVALATHGETVQEVLGSGDSTQSFQKFTLRQPPLTYVSASTPGGIETTLEVRVNDLLWKEVASFYGHGPDERVYITRIDDDGKTTVIFGDGKTGARLPTGQENVKVKYRKGIGLQGLVKENQLSQLMTRPLGVKAATNPIASSDSADRESISDARRNAPLTVMTLDRTVSLQDYEDFARAFAGIDKALAIWSWTGLRRSVFVTVAGSGGAEVKDDGKLHDNLLDAMREFGDPNVLLQIKSYRPRLFRVKAEIEVKSDYMPEKVLLEVGKKMRQSFSFDSREFGQPVRYSEVIAVLQNVQGVNAVNVRKLYYSKEEPDLNDYLVAAIPVPGDKEIFAAELLTIDPYPLELEVKP